MRQPTASQFNRCVVSPLRSAFLDAYAPLYRPVDSRAALAGHGVLNWLYAAHFDKRLRHAELLSK